jgi:putative ABC transport system permease protein
VIPAGLVARNLLKHPVRSLLTVLSLAIAIFLLCALRTLVVALDAGVRSAASNRIVVQSSVSLFVYLPESYEAKIRQVEGVDEIVRWNWFGGYYQEPQNFFAQFATDADRLIDVYPEIEVVAGSREAFEAERTACIVGHATAEKYGFELGDTIPIVGTIFPRTDGEPWAFKLVGIYRSSKETVDQNTLFFHAEYLEQALENGATQGPAGVGIYVVRLTPGADRNAVMSAIDALFAGGPQRVQTTTEAEFQAQFVSMVGNVPLFISSIGTAVTFAIVLAVLNTMLMAAREQTRDVGVLKALGFSDGAVFGLLLLQSLCLCALGGALGVLLALGSEGGLRSMLSTMFPNYDVTQRTLLLAALLTLVIGLVAGVAPAWRARRLNAIEALRATA